jgi:amidohydrolase
MPRALVALLVVLAARAHAQEPLIAKIAAELKPSLVACRRDLHQHPELSNREERTARAVADKLRGLGWEVRTGVGRYGVVALLRGGRPGEVVAARADMDALPIDETMEVPYRSQVKGVKHACGHDAHVAILLGTAEVLSRMKATLPGTVKLIFQPAEEGAPTGEKGGARYMIEQGALDNPRPRAIFGLHVMPDLETGRIGWISGAAMASSDRFTLTIKGRSSHGAWPHQGTDAVMIASEAALALQTIRSRKIDPMEPMVLTLGMVRGGRRFNIIADEVTFEGTVRALDDNVRSRIKSLMDETLRGVTSAHGSSYTITWDDAALVTYNAPALVEETLPAMRRAAGEANVLPARSRMVAEDFSYFQKQLPGFFFFLGVRNEAKKITAMNHTPEFDIDEEALPLGVRVMTTILVDHLERHAARK